jgi:hypothetical protein
MRHQQRASPRSPQICGGRMGRSHRAAICEQCERTLSDRMVASSTSLSSLRASKWVRWPNNRDQNPCSCLSYVRHTTPFLSSRTASGEPITRSTSLFDMPSTISRRVFAPARTGVTMPKQSTTTAVVDNRMVPPTSVLRVQHKCAIACLRAMSGRALEATRDAAL